MLATTNAAGADITWTLNGTAVPAADGQWSPSFTGSVEDVATAYADGTYNAELCATVICPDGTTNTQCLTITSNGDREDLTRRLKAPVLEHEQPLFVSEELKQTSRVMVKDENFCIHCGLCAERCPTAAWDMQKSLLQFPKASDYAGGPEGDEESCPQRKAG